MKTLSDNSYDELTQPIIDRQESINDWVLRQIGEKIQRIGRISSSDVNKLIKLRETGADVALINKEIAEITSLQIRDIKNLIKKAALDNYLNAKPFYDYRHKSFIPFNDNTLLKRRMEAIARQTVNEYKNIAKAQAFMLRDPANPKNLVATPLSKAYQQVVDKAIQAASSGVVDYQTAMRQTLKDLASSGLRRVSYNTETGRFFTQRMDTAVRRNLMDGLRAVNQGMQSIVGEQFGADGVELSVHMYPAEDHAEMQGHQYFNSEFAKMQNGEDFLDIQGRKYQGFSRKVGTLNCRHFAISIVVGFAKQNYTDDQLKEILRKNDAGYTLPNGKHLTMYQCTQHQRALETKIRYAKDGQILAKSAGDRQLAEKYQADINKYKKEYEEFSKACGLSVKPEKMRVSGYRPIKIKK